MSEAAAAPTRQTAAPEPSPKNELKLQRKCACGQHTVGGSECAECRRKRLAMQRWPLDRSSSPASRHPHGSAGRSLGRDFSRVRIRGGGEIEPPRRPTQGMGASSEDRQAVDEDLSEMRRRWAELLGTSAPRRPQNSGTAVAAPEPSNAPGPLGGAPFPPAGTGQLGAEETQPGTTAGTAATSLMDTAAEPAEPPSSPGAALLVEDGAAEVAPRQMRRSEFLAALRTAVSRTAESALAGTGRTTADCPYLAFWFGYYAGQEPEHIERAIHRFAPEAARARTARQYIPLLAGRVHRGMEGWARTGEVTGVPDGIPMRETPYPRGETSHRPPVLRNVSRASGIPDAGPVAVHDALDTGRPLDTGVRARMESAFGARFGHVRVHDSSVSARLAASLEARAFTVGQHVAFAAGEYRPGTVVGDALIAHELAHVVQQQSAPATVAKAADGDAYDALEADADRAAAGVLASLWGNAEPGSREPSGHTTPLLRSGLRLQRCSTCSTSGPSTTANTIVCDGSGGIKTKVTEPRLTGAEGVRCGLLDCATRHEESHRTDTLAACSNVCKGEPADTQIVMSSSERARQEIRASDIEIACLKGHLARHKKSGDARCQTLVEHEIPFMERYRDSFK